MTTTELPSIKDFTTPLRHVRDPQVIRGKVMEVANSRFDLVAPENLLRLSEDAYQFTLDLPEAVVTDSGVFSGPLAASYTSSAFANVCERLDIPRRYLERIAWSDVAELNALAAENVSVLAQQSDRMAMFRFLQTSDGLLLRAMRSDKFLTLDCDTALVALMKGLQEHNLDIGEAQMEADITVDRLRIRLHLPQVAVNARELLRDYKSPFDSRPGNELPMIFAGIEVSNSDTGHGAFTVAPRAVVQVCNNGLTRKVEFRQVHIGTQLEQGVIQWSERTFDNALELLTSQINDSVATFISEKYLENLVTEMMRARNTDLPSPARSVEVVGQRFKFSQLEIDSVLNCMMKSGDTSAFGLGQAVTAAAQGVESGDRQTEMESASAEIMSKPDAFVIAA